MCSRPKMLPLLVVSVLFRVCLSLVSADMDITRTCEPIRIDICKGIGYNVTGMPNFVGHDLQQDAQMQLQTFTPLVQYGCSSRLRFFLCSVYVPMCTEKVPQPIGPCRPLCESVQGLCEPVLLEFGFLWPPALNCSQFPPANNEKHMCMEGPDREEQKHVPFRDRRPVRPGVQRGSGNSLSRPRTHHNSAPTRRSMCKHLKSSDRYYYVNGTGRCAPACNADILYSSENKEFAQIWVTVWTCACFLSTLFAILSFLINSSSYRYPERIIIILSGCYFAYSIAYIIRLVGGREDMGCMSESHYSEPLLMQSGLENINCTIVFMVLYYFGMASMLWWVILTYNWCLSAGLKKNPEELESRSAYCHIMAWTVPAIQVIIVLIVRAVDADELTGTCLVGNQDPQTLLKYVIIPSVIYLVVGSFFLILGIVMVYRSKSRSKIGTPQEKWEVLMVRVGIFAILNTIPAACVVAVNFYEYNNKSQWLSADSVERPNVEIVILRIFMSLVAGITTGVWLWLSRNPFPSWGNMQSKFCIRQPAIPVYHPPKHVILLESPLHNIKVKGNVTVV